MRVLVCGGRGYPADKVFAWLDAYPDKSKISTIIHGGANGADRAAGQWGMFEGVDVVVCLADWKGLGPSAGPRRNQRMIDEESPEIVIAFPGGRGTSDMVRRAKKAGIEVLEAK